MNRVISHPVLLGCREGPFCPSVSRVTGTTSIRRMRLTRIRGIAGSPPRSPSVAPFQSPQARGTPRTASADVARPSLSVRGSAASSADRTFSTSAEAGCRCRFHTTTTWTHGLSSGSSRRSISRHFEPGDRPRVDEQHLGPHGRLSRRATPPLCSVQIAYIGRVRQASGQLAAWSASERTEASRYGFHSRASLPGVGRIPALGQFIQARCDDGDPQELVAGPVPPSPPKAGGNDSDWTGRSGRTGEASAASTSRRASR